MIEDILYNIVKDNPGQTAVIDGETTVTYLELYAQKQAFVEYLAGGLKIVKGEKIAVFLPNSVEFIISFFAIAELRAVFVPLNTHLKERELQHYIDRLNISAVITVTGLLTQWGSISKQLDEKRFVVIDTLELLLKQDENIRLEKKNADPEGKSSDDIEVLYLSTSGSTGFPKIVPRTQGNIVSGARNVAESLCITENDRFLSVVPFYHANGFSNCMFLPILKGATIVLMKKFSARKMIQVMQDENITVLFGSPFIFSVLPEVADEGYSISSVRYYLSTGAPMPYGLRKEFSNKFNHSVRQLYGSSETGTISIQLGELSGDEESVGSPLKQVDIKIINREGGELSRSETGEIIVSSPAMTKGYVGEPELNEEIFHKGYFKTGDVGRLDNNANLYISGRKKRVINASGVKVDPVEIENVLMSHDKVKDAYVIGTKNRRGMEIIKAILVAQTGCSVKDVIGYCGDILADYKIPRKVEFADEIPRDILGKVVSTFGEEKDVISS